jgi:hypothetical protein
MRKVIGYLTILQIIMVIVLVFSLIVLFASNTQNNSTDSISISLLLIDIIKASTSSIVSVLVIMLIELVKNKKWDNIFLKLWTIFEWGRTLYTTTKSSLTLSNHYSCHKMHIINESWKNLALFCFLYLRSHKRY